MTISRPLGLLQLHNARRSGVVLAADARSFAKMALTVGLECEDDVVAVEVGSVRSVVFA